MRLISAHIENFGKLSNVDFKFDEGVNVFERENGWGKSTLAAFIKVMLYGFEGEGKRDDLTNERRKYSPWQKGIFGGELVFQDNGKNYKLSKVFGKKALEDDCVLTDNDTSIQINDIDATCVGKAFFHVDGPSYARSVYVSQSDVLTVEGTDDIFTKIGGVTESSDDTPYEKMMDILKKKIDSMSPSRKTGALHKQREEINKIEAELMDEENVERSLNGLNDLQDKYIHDKEELSERLDVLQKEQQEKSGYGKKVEQKKRYDELLAVYNEKEKSYKDNLARLGGKIPEKDEVNGIITKTNELVKLSGSMDGLTSGDEEIREYDDSFSRENIQGRINAWNKRNEIKSAMSTRKASLQMARLTYENNSKSNVDVKLILAVILVIVAVVCLFAVPMAGVIVGVAGVALLLYSLMTKGKNGFAQEMPNEIDLLQSEILRDEQIVRNVEEDIKEFFDGLSIEYREETVSDKLYNLLSVIDKREGILDRQKKFSEAKKKHDDLSKEILEYLTRFGIVVDPDQINDTVQRFRSDAIALWQSKQDRDEAFSRLESFKGEIGDIDSLVNLSIPVDDISLEQIGIEISSITENLTDITNNISQNLGQIDLYRNKYDDLQEERQRLEGLKERLGEDEKKFDYLCKTRELLEKAKQNMALKYTGPVQKSLDKYLAMIMDEDEKEEVVIDANMHITAKEVGQQREIALLSNGFQDLVGICFRMAFADAMYDDERPTLIFDDPFVNFDDDKLDKAKKLLQELGRSYQIVYFTCHKSRI